MSARGWRIYHEHVVLALTEKREAAKGRLSDSLPHHLSRLFFLFFAIQPFLALQHLDQSHSSSDGGAQARPLIGCQPEAAASNLMLLSPNWLLFLSGEAESSTNQPVTHAGRGFRFFFKSFIYMCVPTGRMWLRTDIHTFRLDSRAQ